MNKNKQQNKQKQKQPTVKIAVETKPPKKASVAEDKKRQAKIVGGPQARSDAMVQNFYRSLTDPFNPSVLGAQVPDPFPFPTITYHIHQTNVIGTSNGSFTGSVIFLPNPVLSMIDNTAFVTNTVQAVFSTPMNSYNFPIVGTRANAFFASCSVSDLQAKFSTYRVVSWGIKISNLQPELTATGRIMIAQLPCGDTIPSYPELAATTALAGGNGIFGIGLDKLNSSLVLELPTAVELTVGDFLRGDLSVSGMYTNSNFWTFKTTLNTNSQTVSGFSGDSTSFNTATGVALYSGYKDLTRCVGGSGIVLYFEGMPTNVSNLFQVETIYHIEGTPNFSSTTNNTLVPTSQNKSLVGTVAVVEAVMGKASKLTNCMKFITRGANFLQKHKDTIRSVGGLALGLL